MTGLALCSDHVHALSCSRDRSIFVWDLRAEKHVATNTQRMGGINAIALHPNMKHILSVGQEKKVLNMGQCSSRRSASHVAQQ